MKHARLTLAILLATSWLGCGPTWTLPAVPAPTPGVAAENGGPPPELAPAVEEARRILRPRLAELPGLAVAAGRGGQIVWSEGLGVADLASGRPVTADTRFRIYSLAKPLTATLAVRLQERGAIDLEAPIGRYLDGLDGELGQVTLEQLLSHTAGVRDYRSGEWPRVSRRHCDSALEGIEPFRDDPLIAAPGEGYSYTSFGFVLASAVLESATGVPFPELLRREILAPAGMEHTSVDSPPYDPATTASFYRPASWGRVREAEPWDNSCKFGGGGLLSTAEDLVRFGLALEAGTLVSPGGMGLLFVSRTPEDGSGTGYGLGWGLQQDESGALEHAAHSGGSPGGRSYLLLDPRHRIVVALTANLEGERFGEEATAIHRLLLDAE